MLILVFLQLNHFVHIVLILENLINNKPLYVNNLNKDFINLYLHIFVSDI